VQESSGAQTAYRNLMGNSGNMEVREGVGDNKVKWITGIQFVTSGFNFSWLRISYSGRLWYQGH
jgi:hypothetical protein